MTTIKIATRKIYLKINIGIDGIQILNIVGNGYCSAILWIPQSSIWQFAWSERNPPWCQSSMWPDCARVSPLLLLVGGEMSDPGNKAVWGTWRKIGWGCAVCFTLTLFMTAYYDFPYPIYNLVCIINNSPAIFLNLEPGTQPKLMQAHYHFQLWTCMHRNRNPCNPLFHGQHG